jgi:ammonia channel protein AmtB
MTAAAAYVQCHLSNRLHARLLAYPPLQRRFLVFFMQVGFIALEMGSGRAKNVRNVLLKNLLDAMLAALVWWAFGYALAYGSSAGGVIG